MSNQTESDAQFQARVEEAWYRFIKAHYKKDLLSSCDANRKLLEDFLDRQLLDASQVSNWELALLNCGKKLARTADPVIPTAPAPAPVAVQAPAEVLSEEAELRQIVRENKSDPEAVADQMRARLRAEDARQSAARQVLPATITKERLLADRFLLRKAMERWGHIAVDHRLNGRN